MQQQQQFYQQLQQQQQQFWKQQQQIYQQLQQQLISNPADQIVAAPAQLTQEANTRKDQQAALQKQVHHKLCDSSTSVPPLMSLSEFPNLSPSAPTVHSTAPAKGPSKRKAAVTTQATGESNDYQLGKSFS